MGDHGDVASAHRNEQPDDRIRDQRPASSILLPSPSACDRGQTTRRSSLALGRNHQPRWNGCVRCHCSMDLAQATIGPGMAVFSGFQRVVENDGSDMSVKTASR